MTIRVFIGHLSYQVREKDLDRFFKGYGRVGDIHLKNGFGFVEFDDQRDAEDAIADLNGKDLLGERVTVELAYGSRRSLGEKFIPPPSRDWRSAPPRRQQGSRYGPPTRTEYQLVVENLSSRVGWQDLKDYMRQAGEVTYADAHRLRPNEGVVEFASYRDLKNALHKLDNTELNGRRIRLIEDKRSKSGRHRSRSRSRSRRRSPQSRSPRSRSESRSRSRSRSKSRSPSRSPRPRESRSPVRRSSRHDSPTRSQSRSPSKSPRNATSKSPSPNDDRDS
uniref:Putative alternative splicing factor n=1 Tax=Ornithodoros turicata TaxID=34597 RepID=A0A2R5LB40_9ACAR